MKKTAIFIVQSEPIFRRALCDVITSASDLCVVGDSSLTSTLTSHVVELGPDLVILEWCPSQHQESVSLLDGIRQERPDTRVLIMARESALLMSGRLSELGCQAYLGRHVEPGHLLSTIRDILEGGQPVYGLEHQATLLPSEDNNVERLTSREFQIFELMSRGEITRTIADQMLISIKTVQAHQARIKHKFRVDSITELRRRAILWSIDCGASVG